MKSRWLYWGLGVCIAYIIASSFLPYGVLGLFDSPYFYFGVFLVAYILDSIIIIENDSRYILYLLGLAANALFFMTVDKGNDYLLTRAITIIALIIYTTIVLIAWGVSYLTKEVKCKQNEL